MISAILLAAGQSTRMKGDNKLIKEINGTALINYSIKNLLGSSIDELIIVLGFEKENIKNIIKYNKKIKFVTNKNFKNGISSSIVEGVKKLSNKTEAFFICLGDMPLVGQNVYNKLIKSRNNYNSKKNSSYKKEIIIPTYDGKKGNPILFSKQMKEEILKIKGDLGAKEIINSYPEKILEVAFKNDKILSDFDTQDSFNF